MKSIPIKAKKRSAFFYVALIAHIDLLAICMSFYIPWFLKIGIHGQVFTTDYLIALSLYIFIYYCLAFSERIYSETLFSQTRANLYSSVKIICLAFSLLLFFAFALKETATFSRIWGSTWFSLLFSYILISRLSLKKIQQTLENRGIVGVYTVLVGDPKYVSTVYNAITIQNQPFVKILGYVGPEFDKNSTLIQRLGGVSELRDIITNHDVDNVIICKNWKKSIDIENIVLLTADRSVNIYLASENPLPINMQGQHNTFSLIEIDRKPIDKWHGFLKRLQDIILAFLALLLLWPIMTITAVAIKLESKGPIIFKQHRYGFNNNLINVFKFRSMYTDETDFEAKKLTIRNDPRITKVGRFIRKTSIDELPQLFNVILGNMSLVGPRPHAVQAKAGGKLYNEVVDRYAIRHHVKPGVTGWAQVNGWRGETDTEEKILKRVEYDLHYIKNWSFPFDLFILAKTVYVVLVKKENAY